MYTNENFSFVPGKGYKDCGITLPVVTRELAGFNRKTREFDLPVANEVGVYRATPDGDPVYLAVVGAGYEVVQTAPLLKTAEDAFRRVCTPEQLVGGYYLDEASYHGAQVQRSYILPAVQPMDRDMQGRLGFRMVVSNGYDGRVKVGLLHGFVDFYCTNGMFIGTDIDSFERKHTSGFSLQNVSNQIASALVSVQDQFRVVSDLSRTPAGYDNVQAFFAAVASERRATRLMERFEIEAADRGRNLWAVVSAMTYYSSHDSDEFTIRGSETNDNVSATLMQRQLEVRRWMDGSAWQRLLAA
jgi:hypothetical protein